MARISRRFWQSCMVAAGLFLVVAAVLSRSDSPLTAAKQKPVPPDPDFRLGYNLDYPGDWTNLPPFVDLFKNGRQLHGYCEDDCHPTAHLDVDQHGWVRALQFRDDPSKAYRLVEVILNTSEVRYDQGRRFIVTWEGEGKVEVHGGHQVRREGEKRISFVLGKDLLSLYLRPPRAPAPNYLRNVQVFREDHEAHILRGELFHPDMLAYLAPFGSLRFMDWMQSNSWGRCIGGKQPNADCFLGDGACGKGRCLVPGNFKERPLPDQAMLLHTGQFLDPKRPELGARVGGYPLEVLIDLANRLDKNPHFNVPAAYDDDYLKGFARLIRERLKPGLRASVEYSNEVWNDSFPQAGFARRQATKLWPGEGSGWVQYMAARTEHMCQVIKQELKGQEQRIRCLISPQTGWRDLAPEVLNCPLWTQRHPKQKNCTQHVDAINISGYFAGCLHQNPQLLEQWWAAGKKSALDRAFRQLEHGGEIPSCSGDDEDNLDHTIETYRHFSQLAAQRDLGLTVYEGGTHFELGESMPKEHPGAVALLVAMTRDPRMEALYRKNFDGLRRAGGSVFHVWGWVAPNDTWANSDTPVSFNHPKYRAIVGYVRGQHSPKPKPGTSAPK